MSDDRKLEFYVIAVMLRFMRDGSEDPKENPPISLVTKFGPMTVENAINLAKSIHPLRTPIITNDRNDWHSADMQMILLTDPTQEKINLNDALKRSIGAYFDPPFMLSGKQMSFLQKILAVENPMGLITSGSINGVGFEESGMNEREWTNLLQLLDHK